MDLISRKSIAKEIEVSMRDNPHIDVKIKNNHHTEHQHFLQIIAKQPNYSIDELIKKLDSIKDVCIQRRNSFEKSNNWLYADGMSDGIDEAIEIVKHFFHEYQS